MTRTRSLGSSATSSSRSVSTSPSTALSSTGSTPSTHCASTWTDTERLATMSRKHTNIEAFQQLQECFNSEKDRCAPLRGEIIAETATLEQERETVTRPIMSTMLVAFSQHLDAVNQRWERVREVRQTRQRANGKSANDQPATEAAPPLIAAPPAEGYTNSLNSNDAQEQNS